MNGYSRKRPTFGLGKGRPNLMKQSKLQIEKTLDILKNSYGIQVARRKKN